MEMIESQRFNWNYDIVTGQVAILLDDADEENPFSLPVTTERVNELAAQLDVLYEQSHSRRTRENLVNWRRKVHLIDPVDEKYAVEVSD